MNLHVSVRAIDDTNPGQVYVDKIGPEQLQSFRTRYRLYGMIPNPVDLFFVESEVGFGLLRLPTLGAPGISFGAPGILPGKADVSNPSPGFGMSGADAPYGYQKHLGRKTVFLPYEDFGAPAGSHL